MSKELQLFYEKCTRTVEECSAADRADGALDVVLRCLRVDAGFQPLLPYFSQFIADRVMHNLDHLVLLTNLMKMTDSLLCNVHMNAEPYVSSPVAHPHPSFVLCVIFSIATALIRLLRARSYIN